MSEEYNPEAQTLEEVERVEVELKELLKKRGSAGTDKDRQVLDRQIGELEGRLKRLRAKLVP